jgi:hypothetical protein
MEVVMEEVVLVVDKCWVCPAAAMATIMMIQMKSKICRNAVAANAPASAVSIRPMTTVSLQRESHHMAILHFFS